MSKAFFSPPLSLLENEEAVQRYINFLEAVGFEIVNPANLQDAYREFTESYTEDHPMAFWLAELLPCDTLIVVPFPRDITSPDVPETTQLRIGAGTALLIMDSFSADRSVIYLDPDVTDPEDLDLRPIESMHEAVSGFCLLTVEETEVLLREQGVEI